MFYKILLLVTSVTLATSSLSKEHEETERNTGKDCDTIHCTSPPEGYSCLKTNITNPKILRQLGPLKDCCPAWYCTDESSLGVLFLGISGKTNSPSSVFHKATTFDSLSGVNCENVSCPILTPPGMTCAIDTQPDSDFLALHKGYTSCCPTMRCRREGRDVRLFIAHGGSQASEQKAMSDTPGQDKCNMISCAEKPSALSHASCDRVPIAGSLEPQEIQALGEFHACCPFLWQCKTGNNSIYLVFEISGTSLKHYSTVLIEADKSVFFSPPPETTKASEEAHCSKVTCPDQKRNSSDKCIVEKNYRGIISQVIMEKGDCCHSYNCTDSEGYTRISFSISEGTKPTMDADKMNESEYCKDFECGRKPMMENVICLVRDSKEQESIIAVGLGRLRDCCPIFDCEYPNGTLFQVYQISGQGYDYKEFLVDEEIDEEEEKAKNSSKGDIPEDKNEAGEEKPKNVLKADTPEDKNKGEEEKPTSSTSSPSASNQESDNGTSKTSTKKEKRGKNREKKGKKKSQVKKDQVSNLGVNNEGGNEASKIEPEPTQAKRKKTRNEKVSKKRSKSGKNGDSGDIEYDFEPSVCDPSMCPQPQNVGQCTPHSSHVTEDSKPFKNCCPTQVCSLPGGEAAYQSATLWGKIPSSTGRGRTIDSNPRNGSRSSKSRGICSKVVCDLAAVEPTAKNCSKLSSSQVPGMEVIGDYKNCCPLLSCHLEGSGSEIRHFGMRSKSFRYLNVFYTSLPLKLAESQQQAFSGAGGIATCPSDDDICPEIDSRGDTCYKDETLGGSRYVPENSNCCPVTRCLDMFGSQRTSYVKHTGKIPTRKADVDMIKGKYSKDAEKSCPLISCGQDSSPSCASSTGEKPVFNEIAPFLECCPMKECSHPDGSYSLELQIISTHFKFIEMSFYNIPSSAGNFFQGSTKTSSQSSSFFQADTLSEKTEAKWTSISPPTPATPSGYPEPWWNWSPPTDDINANLDVQDSQQSIDLPSPNHVVNIDDVIPQDKLVNVDNIVSQGRKGAEENLVAQDSKTPQDNPMSQDNDNKNPQENNFPQSKSKQEESKIQPETNPFWWMVQSRTPEQYGNPGQFGYPVQIPQQFGGIGQPNGMLPLGGGNFANIFANPFIFPPG